MRIEVTEIRESASSGFRVLLHTKKTRRGSHTAGSRERHERMTARRARKRAAELELTDSVPELRDRNDEKS